MTAAQIEVEARRLIADAGLSVNSVEVYGTPGETSGFLHFATTKGLRVLRFFADDQPVSWASNAANFASLFSPTAVAEIRQLAKGGADASIIADRIRDEGYEIDPKKVEILAFNMRSSPRHLVTMVEAFAVGVVVGR